jgi:hypothetical protein
MIPSPFSIRLAALAFRKELVELEKWLSNNLNTYKDAFFEVMQFWLLFPAALLGHNNPNIPSLCAAYILYFF